MGIFGRNHCSCRGDCCLPAMKTLTMVAALVGAVVLAPMAAVAHSGEPGPAAVDFRALAFEGGQSSNAMSSCSRERMRGEEAGAHHGTGGTIAFSAVLPVIGLLYVFAADADGSNQPSPPEAMMTGMTGIDAVCFAEGYQHTARSKRRRHAKWGTVVGVAAWLSLAVILGPPDSGIGGCSPYRLCSILGR